MAMVQCQSGHTYDDRKHTHCPYCPVPGLKDVAIPGTQAAAMGRPGMPETEPASPVGGADAAIRADGGSDRGPRAGKTIGIFQRHMHMDPVVGWLVCIKGSQKGRDYRLHSDRNKLGRDPGMDVCIEGDDSISRENHCQIAYSPRSKTFMLIPGDGRNLIYLNNEDVFSEKKLQAYDRLDLGESTFMFIPFCTDRFDWGLPAGTEPEPQPEKTRPPTPSPVVPRFSPDTEAARREPDKPSPHRRHHPDEPEVV